MSQADAILVRRKTVGAITRIELNRPHALNALDEATAEAFAATVARVAREPSRVVILSGAGRAFCSGGDLAFIARNTRRKPAPLRRIMRRFYGAFLGIRCLPQITIAQVHGAAVGAGLCLALACDLRAVTAAAKLALNFLRVGLSPGMAAWPLSRAAFGDARARELLTTARFFSGRDLHAWGAAARLARDEQELCRMTDALAAEIAGMPAHALRLLKEELASGEDLTPYLKLEARAQAACFPLMGKVPQPPV